MTASQPDLERLVDAHQREVWLYLRYLGAGPETADDLTQDVFVNLCGSGFSGFIERSEAETASYLRKCAHNLYVTWLRRFKRERDILERQLANGDQWDSLWAVQCPGGRLDDWLVALEACLERLGERPREAVELRYTKGLSRAELARVMGVRESGAAQMLQRALSELRECMAQRIERIEQ